MGTDQKEQIFFDREILVRTNDNVDNSILIVNINPAIHYDHIVFWRIFYSTEKIIN